jgi:hypothetical protein
VLPFHNTRLLWSLVAAYYEKRSIHFVQSTGSCMTCSKRFDEYDARQCGYAMLNTWVRPARSWYEDEDWKYEYLQ